MIDDFTAVDATNVSSAGSGLKLDVLNITTAGAHGTTNVAAGNKGSNYEVGDTLKVLGSAMAGDDGANDFNYTVATLDTATTQVKTLNYGMPTQLDSLVGLTIMYRIQVGTCS